jgi:hypothetical protein
VSALRLRRVFETEPVLVSYLVGLVVWKQPCADLSAVFGAGALFEASLRELDDALARAETFADVTRTIQGERVFMLGELASNLGWQWPADGARRDDRACRSCDRERRHSADRVSFWTRRRLLREARDSLAVSVAMIQAAGEPWPQVLDGISAVVASRSDAAACDSDAGAYWLTALDRAGRSLAATRAGRVAVAVERYRRRHGSLPTSLELPGAMPL